MRPREDELIDPEIAEQLDAIDATLAGDPVDPRFAELAELALLLAAGRPEGPRPEFAAELDRRVAARFGRGVAASSVSPGGGRSAVSAKGFWRRWGLGPMLGTAATALAAVVVAVAVVTSGGGSRPVLDASPAVRGLASASLPTMTAASRPVAAGTNTTSATSTTSAAGAGGSGAGASGGSGSAHAAAGGLGFHAPSAAAPPVVLGPAPERAIKRPSTKQTPASGSGASSGPAISTGSVNSSASQSLSPAPIPNGRKIIQSSILELGAPAKRIDAVAQEVFNVVSSVSGIVDSSNVASSGGPGASAQFQLRVPSALLSQALTDLSRLRFANVISRTDATQDVNGSYLSTQRHIAAAEAALVTLRAKLAAATDPTAIASLRAQIAAEKATLGQGRGSLRSLNRQIDYTRVEVSVLATTGPPAGGGGGFGLRSAGHDAIRVLEVAAGVALIVLAVLVPLGLLVALAWWLALTVQRRRRERALDMA